MARIARPLQSLRGAQWPQRATARCNYSAATLRPHRWFFRANARSAFAASRYSAMQLQRGCAAPQNMCLSIRAAARMDVPKLLASRAARCNNSAATPRPHRRSFNANALPRVSTTRGYAATHTRYARHTLASLAHSQEFISTSLFDSSMSALPIIAKQNSPSVGLFTH